MPLTTETKSACYWLDHEQISDTSNNKFSFYFTKNDEPLILYDHFFNANGTRKSADSGTIARVEIRTGGSGYSSAPSVTISAPTSGTTATATATADMYSGTDLFNIETRDLPVFP